MTVATNTHIVIDDKGKARVAPHGLPVSYIIAEHNRGATPALLQEYWPHLTLSQLYAALTYYYDHKLEIDAKAEEEGREFEQLRAEAIASGKQPTREQLLRQLAERGKKL